MRRVVVTGVGAVTPLGIGASRSWRRLIDGESGLTALRPQNYPHEISQQVCRVAGLVPSDQWQASLEQEFSRDERRQTSTFMKYAILAAKEALEDARWYPKTCSEADRTGTCIGSGIGSLETVYDASIQLKCGDARRLSPYFIPKLLVNLAAGHVSIKFGFKGPSHTASTACATGAHSIGDAARLIAEGDADVILAGGAEAPIHPLAFIGFERSRSLCITSNENPVKASRPFDKTRDGFVIGEGAAILVLEELQHAIGRGATVYAELKGYGLSSDAHHITSPPADGKGALRAMQRALAQAALTPEDVDYVNAHAASTMLGDVAELRAIGDLCRGDHTTQSRQSITLSSNKGAIGHLLGASGAVEAVFTVLALRHSVIPATVNLLDIDQAADNRIHFVRHQSEHRDLEVCLSNSFGFGGTNTSLCFTKYPP